MRLDGDTWREIEALFSAALERPEDERASYVEAACGDREAVRDALLGMLAADSDEGLRVERSLLAPPAEPEEVPDLAGRRYGAYRVVHLIGRGGMGEVYLAERDDDLYRQRVAIKLVRPGARPHEHAERFRLERQILARLEHPNIATLLDGGIEDGVPYLVMQYVDGVPITEYCDRERLPIDRRLELFLTACETVAFAHSRFVVHRDIKPSNILVTDAAEIRLLDFGIAKLLDAGDGGEAFATRAETRILTPEYAAPEQILGGEITTATDVYGLGVLLYRLLTGRSPHRPTAGGQDVERIARDVDAQRPSAAPTRTVAGDEPSAAEIAAARGSAVKTLCRRLRGDLDAILLKALSKEPRRRYRSAERLGADIRSHLAGEPIAGRRAEGLYRAAKFVRRHPVGTLASFAFAALLIAFSVTSRLQSLRIAGERDRARIQEQRAQRVIELLVDLFEASDPTKNPGGDTMPVTEFLDLGEARVAELDDQPEIQARLWQVLGQIHDARSKLPESRLLLERALAQRRALGATGDAEMLELIRQLGRTLRRLGEREAAEAHLRESLELAVELYGESHPEVARSLQDLGELLGGAAGSALLESALTMRRESLPPDHVDIADSLNALGLARLGAGQRDEARRLFAQSLDIVVAALGAEHPHAVAVLGNVAALTTDLDEREALDRRRLEILEAIYEPTSWNIANGKNNLALTLSSRGDHAEAEAMLRDATAIWLAVGGPDHLELANTTRNLGVVVDLQRRPSEAREILVEAIEIGRRGGMAPIHHGLMHSQLAVAELGLGRSVEAVELARTGLALIERGVEEEGLPEGYRNRIDGLEALGLSLLSAGRPEAAEPPLRRALELRREVAAADDPARAAAACALAAALAELDRTGEARALLDDAWERVEGWGRAHPVLVDRVRAVLARHEPAAR